MNNLIQKYAYLVDLTIKKYIPEKRYDDDYKQIGMIALWFALKSYKKEKYAFTTYASRVIRNKLISEYRKETSSKRQLDNKNNVISLQSTIKQDSEIQIEEIIEDKTNQIIDIRGFINDLTEEEIQVVRIKSTGISNKEIARKLKISRKEADKRVNKAKEKLKNNVL